MASILRVKRIEPPTSGGLIIDGPVTKDYRSGEVIASRFSG